MAGEKEPRSPQAELIINSTLRTLIEWFNPDAAAKSPTGMASLIQKQLWQLVTPREGNPPFTPEGMMNWATILIRDVFELTNLRRPTNSDRVRHQRIGAAQEAIMGRPGATEAFLSDEGEDLYSIPIRAVAHLVRAVQSGFYDGRFINPDFWVPQMEKPDVVCIKEDTLAAADHLRTGLILLAQQLTPRGRV